MPRISIIVPVYNTAPFLNRCFNSLAAMTFHDFEVIAVDDGSDDDSWTIIQKFAQHDPRYSRSFRTLHSGLGPARNRGLEAARGEFVAFVDSDDYVDPEYCGAPYALACKQKADLVCFGSWWVYPDHQERHHPACRTGMTPHEAILGMTPSVWDKLYRRHFLQSRQLNFPAIYHEDEVFTPILMAHAPNVAVLDHPLYYYVKRNGGISGLRVNPNSIDVLKAFRLVIDQSRSFPEFRYELEFYAFRFLSYSFSCWKSCEENWSIDCVSQATLLLNSLDRPESDNPYLIRMRHHRRNRFAYFGHRLQRWATHCLHSVV